MNIIKVMSHEQRGVSNHRQLDCLPDSLSRLTPKEASNPRVLVLCGRGGIPVRQSSKFPSTNETLCRDVYHRWSVDSPNNELRWRHDLCDGVSNHRRLDCLLDRLFRRRSKKTSRFHVNGLCEGNPPVTGGFPNPPVDSPQKGQLRGKCFYLMTSSLQKAFPYHEVTILSSDTTALGCWSATNSFLLSASPVILISNVLFGLRNPRYDNDVFIN